jgi:hypothetical protein
LKLKTHRKEKHMKKKPKLTNGAPDDDPTSMAPRTLGKAGAALWHTMTTEHEIRKARDLEMLMQICTAADRTEECQKIIDRDGPMVEGKNGPREHPLLRHEAIARAFLVRSLQRLKADINPVGRPTHGFGVSWKTLAEKNNE